jgi:HSP20 family protein
MKMFRTIPFNFKNSASERGRDFFDRFYDFAMEQAHNPASRFASAIFPFSVDALEGDSQYVIVAELPGFSKDEVTVSYDEDRKVLTISAERPEADPGTGRYLCRERRTGKFERSFEVDGIAKDGVSVSLENGVLRVVLPKAPSETEKTVFNID